MENKIKQIVDAMCAPGLAAMSPSDLAFINECSTYSFSELEGNTVGEAVAGLDDSCLSGFKNVAVSIFSHKDDRHVSINEIACLQSIFENLDKDVNVVWSFAFADVPVGKRKVMLLLAS